MRKFAFYLAPKFSMMSLLSMTEPLRAANEIAGKPVYDYSFFGGSPMTTAINGMAIATETTMVKRKLFDVIIVCASYEADKGVNRKVVDWLRWLGTHGVILGSADTGAYITAATGIWGDTPVAMHWFSRPAFEARHPDVRVSGNTMELGESRISCAGATTGIDMMLQIMKLDHGIEFSGKVANHFIYNNGKERPPTEQTALSELLRGIRTPAVQKALKIMEAGTETRVAIARIAASVGLTTKQLERHFKDEVGDTPSRVYQQIRLARANHLLNETSLPIEQIATACGFTSRTQFSAVFKLRYGMPPSAARKT